MTKLEMNTMESIQKNLKRIADALENANQLVSDQNDMARKVMTPPNFISEDGIIGAKQCLVRNGFQEGEADGVVRDVILALHGIDICE